MTFRLRPLPLLISALFANPALAGVPAPTALPPTTLPQGGQVVAGQASLSASGARLDITQTTQRAILDWQSFNIGAAAQVNFAQPNSTAVALNRVLAGDASQIHGQLSANGQVFLVNPSGVLFAPGSRVDVGGLVASTLNITNDDFMAGRLRFERNGATGGIRNQGNLSAADGGYIALLAPEVINEGVVSARLGSVAFAAGERATLSVGADGRLSVALDPATVNTLIENRHLVQADGGTVLMSAQAAGTLLQAVVANPGAIQARTLENRAGRILLLADMQQGEVRLSGSIDASAPATPSPLAGEGWGEGVAANGGFVETSAAHVKIADSARVTTLAANGKNGIWLIDPNDYTIAAAGGDISGATLATNLAGGNITIQSTNGGAGTAGDVNVNDVVAWSANTLTLNAQNNININANLNGSGTAKLALEYGQGAVAAGNLSDYIVHAAVNLPAGPNFSTKLGSDGVVANYTVITGLGVAGDATTTTLQGMKNNLTGKYVLGSNIDASATSGWNAGAGFEPVGTSATRYTGRFDGLGHTVTSLTINLPATDDVGLFGYIDTGSAIRNVGLVGGSVIGRWDVGALVGTSWNGSISYSYATGNVSGSRLTGGLVGVSNSSSASISNSYATGNVTGGAGQQYTGGLVGFMNGSVSNSYATGSVSGADSVGGLAGRNSAGGISNSYATGSVTGSSNVGGLVGMNGGGVSNSYWNTQTSGQATSAGGTGKTTAGMKQLASFSGWDISASGGSNAVWRIYEGQTAPLLRGFLTPSTVTANAASKTYDGLAYSGGNGITCSTGSCAAANYLGAAAYSGTSQGAINANTYVLTPSGLYSNQQGYDISYANGVLTVTPAPLTATANAASKTYDGNAYSGGNGIAYSGFVNGETSAVLGGALAYGGSSQGATNAGSYTLVPSGLTAGNYTLSFANGVLTVDPRAITVTASDRTRAYGSANTTTGSTTVTTGTLAGSDALGNATLTAAGSATATANAGTAHTLTPSAQILSTGSTANYTISYANGTLTITPAPLTATANAASKTYDGNAYSGGNGVAYSGFVNGETSTVLGGTLAYGGTSQGAVNAGSYAVAPSGLTSGNYTLSFANGTLTVTPTPLTATASAASKTYDGNAYSGGNGVAYSGFVNGETSAVLGGTLAWGGSSQGAINAGSYAVAPSGLTSGNYTISYANGTLTVDPRAITVTASNRTRAYGSANPTTGSTTVTTGTLAGSDALGNATLAAAGSATATANAGTAHTLTPSAQLLSTGSAANYTISYANGTLTITPAPLTATANAASKTYDGNAYSGGNGVIYSGFVNGETSTVLGGTLAWGGTSQGATNAGSYTLTLSGLAAGNYTISYANGVLTIAAVPEPATANGVTGGDIARALAERPVAAPPQAAPALMAAASPAALNAVMSTIPGLMEIRTDFVRLPGE